MEIQEAKTIVRARVRRLSDTHVSNLVHHAHEETGIVLAEIQSMWISIDGKCG